MPKAANVPVLTGWSANVPVLAGWASVAEIRSRLGVSRQTVHQMFRNAEFKTIHRIGSIYVVETSELESMAEQREFPRSKNSVPPTP